MSKACMLLAAALAMPGLACGANTPLITNGTTITAQGDQSEGISVTSGFNTMNVNSLSEPIQPATGILGINFLNPAGGNVALNAGTPQSNIVVQTTGNGATGMVARSHGSCSSTDDPFLGISIPGASNNPGGVVVIDSYSDITTVGTNAPGIGAESRTAGYPGNLYAELTNFSSVGFLFSVSNIVGSTNPLGTAVMGQILDTNGVVLGTGGTFTLAANGAATFSLGTNFDNLAAGEVRLVTLGYNVTGESPSSVLKTIPASLVVVVSNLGGVIFSSPISSSFPEYGSSTNSFPDLDSYVAGLVALTEVGGPGNSVTIVQSGEIVTRGTNAAGISALSVGARGADGRDADIDDSSTWGGAGNSGGHVSVTADGRITTAGEGSPGILARSVGGDGGQGGDASDWGRNSKSGGIGGSGGDVTVAGGATIVTSNALSSGVLAISQGGNGGGGGDGATFNSADDGGAGGAGGSVNVNGTWDITTLGSNSHGIWGKSVGGIAGGGGDGGWTGTAAGDGGQATGGGDVSITSGGTIVTRGMDSYGIYGESVDGFGGGGGSAGSPFVAFGGSGASAGPGGNVAITNTGGVTTYGARSHAVYAQSVGGGGGSGGSAWALAGFGGGSGSGGHGGDVQVSNSGRLQTFGSNSIGIYAHSVGGGGGDGGNSAGLVAIGGQGSGTSAGGKVNVVNSGDIDSTAEAIFAQSIGGGGGNGGSTIGWFSIGGNGGSGGNADAVTVSNSGSLTTRENDASGIFAQSVGGGGGSGGNSVAVGALVSMAIGGAGAAGGTGACVNVWNTAGEIETFGDRSCGIFAESLGGGGGSGGFAFAGAVGPGSFAIGIGGTGGGGGDSDAVNVDARGASVTTWGVESHGVVAQSVGGGGGSGGFGIALSVGFETVGFALGLGGSGGGGGSGAAVTLTTAGDIETFGHRSHGVLAQSVGGGGGDGGFSISVAGGAVGAVAYAMGGSGGGGGSGSTVTVTNGADIVTRGTNSHGILAQSVGGGGGSGGFSGALSLAGTANASIGMGGKGGGGGGGDAVSVVSLGDTIVTSNEHSYGILAQSVGGGGGDGGFSLSAAGSLGLGVGFGLGGTGGTGGVGRTVFLSNVSDIATYGPESHGILAQSLGGGGGSGGFSIAGAFSSGAGALAIGLGGQGGGGGNGDAVTVINAGDIRTLGDRSSGVLAQSVGGGGGAGGLSGALTLSAKLSAEASIGGSGGTASHGGAVHVENSSMLWTEGDDSNGILAQSIGGGGGVGGMSLAFAGSAHGLAGGLNMGGDGGGGGDGSTVDVVSTGAYIETRGDRSAGILAQSVGGGGGNGGLSIAGALALESKAFTLALGGDAGVGGRGSNVTLRSSSVVQTLGDDAHAIVGQSIGGGGGTGGVGIKGQLAISDSGVSISVGSQSVSGAGGGDAGNVHVTSTGASIETRGIHSYGVFAQSVGGGGGDGGFCFSAGFSSGGILPGLGLSLGADGGQGGSAGEVILDSATIVQTTNDNSHALFAQSVGGGGGAGGVSIAIGVGTKALAVSLGGDGGAGGHADDVSLTSSGASILTFGNHAAGLMAQSVGGGGGDGGGSVAIAVAGGEKIPALSVSVGGSGGPGSYAGSVTVTNRSTVQTRGNDSQGIHAQSVGGGGGNGGFSVSGSFDATSASIGASFGGSGGSGGYADDVFVLNTGGMIGTVGDRSSGIQAQSLGGGGGSGGFSIGLGASICASFSLGVGGNGGTGGDGGAVEVTSSSFIQTSGDGASGIMAQSVGGGGGSGGFSFEGSVSAVGGASISIGGGGGVGGDGGTVGVMSSGSIQTAGNDASGIMAQSVGGGGGSGGWSMAGRVDAVGGIALSFGGFADAGGQGDDVSVISTGASITTEGDRSGGIMAQSVGGSGGAGGGSYGQGISMVGNYTMGIGRDGGAGGDGGSVLVTSSSSIETEGDDAIGILAQSVGGGGGAGGSSFAGGLALVGVEGTMEVGLAGVGGAGGVVVATSTGAVIITEGARSHGILAQSVGGGGGSGGVTVQEDLESYTNGALAVTLGSTIGLSNDAQSVTITNTAAVGTYGEHAGALVAQSIGGGGGASGIQIGGMATGLSEISVVLGGHDSAGDGAIATVYNLGSLISTTGGVSPGLLAQSIGGGGGLGGITVGGDVHMASVAFGAVLGSSGSVASAAANVFVQNDGETETFGIDSAGILAQSIGGGGGLAATHLGGSLMHSPEIGLVLGGSGAGGNGGEVNLATMGEAVVTHGTRSPGILAQSIGAGGGAGGVSVGGGLSVDPAPVGMHFGATGSGTGNGGGVTVSNLASVGTDGDDSPGILAQSIGGGGGFGGIDVGGTVVGVTTNRIALGGGQGGGGAVHVISIQDLISTEGKRSVGIFAQSVGGGGGAASWLGGAEGAAEVALANSALGNGDGGAVTVDSIGDIVTHGAGAHGIFAQSVGGGGGVASALGEGFSGTTLLNFAGSAGGPGAGGPVSVEHTGNILTYGDTAHGIFAQSEGGIASAGNIHVGIDGAAIASGLDSDGIRAQSHGLPLNGDIDVLVGTNGTVVGGTQGGAGIRLIDGADNSVLNHGSVTAIGGVFGNAMIAGIGNETIDNFGAVSGNLDLGGGHNTFLNHLGGIFNTGARLYLGPGGALMNGGSLSPGGEGLIMRTQMTGDLVGLDSGSLMMEIKSGGICDVVENIGGAMTLDGSLHVLQYQGSIPHRGETFQLLEALGGIGGQFDTISDPFEGRYALKLVPHYLANAFVIEVQQGSFAWFAETYNQRQVANALDSVAFSHGTRKLIEFLNGEPGYALPHDFDLIAPEELGAMFDLTFGSMWVHSRNLEQRLRDLRAGGWLGLGQLSLLDPAGALDPKSVEGKGMETELSVVEAPCDWNLYAMGSGEIVGVSDTRNSRGYDIETGGITIGGDRRLGEHFAVGLALGYVDSRADLYGGGRVDVNGGMATIYGTWYDRGCYVNAAVGGGYDSYDTRREGLQGRPRGTTCGGEFDALVGAGYDFRAGAFAFGPEVAVQYGYVGIGGFRESGSLAPLQIQDNDSDSLLSRLGFHAAAEFLCGGVRVRPQAVIAWQHEYLDDERSIDSAFAGDTGEIFNVRSTSTGRDALSVGGGVHVQWSRLLSTSLFYHGEIARSEYSAHSLTLGMGFSF